MVDLDAIGVVREVGGLVEASGRPGLPLARLLLLLEEYAPGSYEEAMDVCSRRFTFAQLRKMARVARRWPAVIADEWVAAGAGYEHFAMLTRPALTEDDAIALLVENATDGDFAIDHLAAIIREELRQRRPASSWLAFPDTAQPTMGEYIASRLFHDTVISISAKRAESLGQEAAVAAYRWLEAREPLR